MSVSVLVDTNVLVYAYDRSEPEKQRQARRVLAALADRRIGALSTQVLGEFFVVVTRRIDTPLSNDEAYERAANLLSGWPVISMTGIAVLEAMRGVRDYHLSYYDAQLWATAKLNHISIVLSEDFQDGQVVEGVRFVNPFAVGFLLSDWIP
jgi:predicted nucleic acid-binding protein